MRLLLGSGGFRTSERIRLLVGQMREVFGEREKVLFIPYALSDHDGYVNAMIDKGMNARYQLDGIHRHANPVAAVDAADAIFVGGGNTFRLLAELYRRDLLMPIRRRVQQGMPYLGISAGCNVACPTIKTTNDMPITAPPSLDALALVPFQVNPHYFSGQTFVKDGSEYREHFGETRDERIREFHEMNETTVIGLWEGGILRVDDRSMQLLGAPARLFRKGRPPEPVPEGARLDAVLTDGESLG